MKPRNFLKPFAVTVGALLVSVEAQAAVAPQVASAVESISLSAGSGMADLVLATSDSVLTADARHGSHSSHVSHGSHGSHGSHASHSSHSSSSY